jgi:hypothetical protein
MKTLLGNHPLTSIVGYALAGLTTADALFKSGNTNYLQIGMAVLLAVLGRVAADSNNVNSQPPTK